MSEFKVNVCKPDVDQDGSSLVTVPCSCSGTSSLNLQGLLPPVRPSSADDSPSPSGEASGLLSLPWEMVTHIASHLPAHCIIKVLPKVCHALGNLGKDSTAWQLRSRRIIGSREGFPVGPREDFDWPMACLEMEQLINYWTGQGPLVAREIEDYGEGMEQGRQQQGAGNDWVLDAGRQQHGREDELDGVGVAAQEIAYGGDEGMEVAMEGEDGEMQPIVVVDQLERMKEALEKRVADDVAARVHEDRDHRIVLDADEGQAGDLNHKDLVGDARHQGDVEKVEKRQSNTTRCPSPPPALEHISIRSGHIAPISSVLLMGKDGTVCATGSRDRNVKLWDLQAGSGATLLHTLGGRGDFTHRGWVSCLASRGPLLASGCFDSTVRLWDLQAGGAGRNLIRVGAAVICLSYQSDVLLAGTSDKRVNMYDIRASEPLVKSLRLHGNPVLCLAADEKYIISGSEDCTVALYDRRAGKGLKRLRLRSYLLSMSYSGCEIWAGDNGGRLHSFSMQTGTLKPLSQFDVGHTALVTGIHKSTGSLYTCSSDRTVKVHIPSAPPRTLCTLHHQDGVNGLSVKDGVLAVASGDMGLEVWRPRI